MITRGPLRPLVVMAFVACLPVFALAVVLPRPIALSAWLGTTAIALHWPDRYREDRHRISAAYFRGFAVMAVVALVGSLVGAPGWLVSAVGLLVLITSPAASWHPPIACLPFAVAMTTPSATLLDWGLLGVLTSAYLWCLGRVTGVLSRQRPERCRRGGDPK